MSKEYVKGIAPCKGTCGRMTRPNTRKTSDFPGTVARHKNGICRPCLRDLDPENAPRIYKKSVKVKPMTEIDMAMARSALDSFLSGRRRRIISAPQRMSMGRPAHSYRESITQ